MGPADWIKDLEEGWKREYPGVDLSTLPPMVRLARLAMLFQNFQVRTLEPFGLTPADYSVLAALRRVGPPYRASPSGLYNVLQRSSGGMTKMLKRLEKLELVTRTPDPSDGRGSLVALTRTGLRVQEKAFRALLAGTSELLGNVPGRRVEEIDRSLRLLLDTFEAELSGGS